MPKEMDTGSRDLSPLRPYKRHPDLIALAVAALGFMFLLWWAGVFGADQSQTEPPAPGPAVYLSPPISVKPAPPPRPPLPRRVLTEHEILAQLNTTATEWLWIGRAAVLIIGLGVLGIFAVGRRLQKVARARDREIDLLTGVALGQQRDLLAQLKERPPLDPPSPPWDDLDR